MAIRDYNVGARLTVGDSSVPISSFTAEFPEGVLGSRVQCELADIQNAGPVQESTSSVVLEIGVGPGSGMDWVPVMDMGLINQAQSGVKWLADSATLQAISSIADKWNFSPLVPEFLYDPNAIDPLETNEAALGDVVDENHLPIFPQLISIPSLDLTQLLNYVYVQKLGFVSVVTNIPNFNLNFVNIPLGSSYHSAAESEVSVFQPEYHCDDAGVLWIIDPQGALPSGLQPRKMQLKHYAEYQKSRQTTQVVNSVILSYRENFFGGPVSSRVVQEVQEVGQVFTDAWQRTVVNRFITDFHDNPKNLLEVTRSVVTRVLTQVSAHSDNAVRLVLNEDQTDLFMYNFRLKVGFRKTTSIYTKVPNQSARLRQAQTEINQIVWDGLSVPGSFVKRFELTQVTGSVIKVPSDPDDPSGPGVQTSLFNANRADNVPDDAILLENRPISTQIDTYRAVGRDQIEVGSQKINHLVASAAPERSQSFSHTGTIEARAITSNATQVNMLLRKVQDGDHPRVPVQLNAGNIPFGVAKVLAQRILDRQGAQPARVSLELSGLDLALRRGSLRNVHDRANNIVTVFITGYSISGEALGTPQFKVTMRAQGVVING